MEIGLSVVNLTITAVNSWQLNVVEVQLLTDR